MRNKITLGSEKANVDLLVQLLCQIELLCELRQQVKTSSGEVGEVLFPLLITLAETGRSMREAVRFTRLRDCYIFGRVILEIAINMCFVCARGEIAARRAKSHALQKSFRDLNREIKINSGKFVIQHLLAEKQSASDELQDALKEFTHKNGREVRSWTPEDLVKRIEVIDNKYGAKISGPFGLAVLAIYRHSSEIMHGTYFGALFYAGLTVPSKRADSKDQLKVRFKEQISMILLALSSSISGLVQVLAGEFDVVPVGNQSKKLSYELKEEMRKEWVGFESGN